MTMKYEVVETGQWPSGDQKPAAVLRSDVGYFEHQVGRAFSKGMDDLGAFRQMALRLASGRLVLLARHEDEPNPGVTVYIDSTDDIRTALDELTLALQLTVTDFLWVSPAVEAQ